MDLKTSARVPRKGPSMKEEILSGSLEIRGALLTGGARALRAPCMRLWEKDEVVLGGVRRNGADGNGEMAESQQTELRENIS